MAGRRLISNAHTKGIQPPSDILLDLTSTTALVEVIVLQWQKSSSPSHKAWIKGGCFPGNINRWLYCVWCWLS